MFINELPYNLGTSFDDCNTGLTFIQENINKGKQYKSYKFSEVYMFGEVFDSNCFLWFKNNEISRIEYLFDLSYFDFFFNSINKNLSKEYFLEKDPLNSIEMYDCFLEEYCISLNKLKDYIRLEIWRIES
nr:hypothetical protein BACT7_17870 [Tenacibaculum mesophilum]